MRAALVTFPYLILLRVEFGCFHSNGSSKVSRSQPRDHSLGHSFCSTVPHLTTEGRYPLRCSLKSGLSSQKNLSDDFSKPTAYRDIAFSIKIQILIQMPNLFFIVLLINNRIGPLKPCLSVYKTYTGVYFL